jgi:hypothetical protein
VEIGASNIHTDRFSVLLTLIGWGAAPRLIARFVQIRSHNLRPRAEEVDRGRRGHFEMFAQTPKLKASHQRLFHVKFDMKRIFNKRVPLRLLLSVPNIIANAVETSDRRKLIEPGKVQVKTRRQRNIIPQQLVGAAQITFHPVRCA